MVPATIVERGTAQRAKLALDLVEAGSRLTIRLAGHAVCLYWGEGMLSLGLNLRHWGLSRGRYRQGNTVIHDTHVGPISVRSYKVAAR
jgi:hypothetical protein